MNIRDKIASWWVKNVIMTGKHNFKNPGYITEKIDKERTQEIRDICLPEKLLAKIEERFHKKELGYAIYAIGKDFGYRYAKALSLPQLEKETGLPGKRFETMAYFIIRYIEGTFAKDINYSLDLELRKFNMKMKDYLVCRRNGLGYIFSTGGVAGIWGYIVQKDIEGVQTKCEGRGDDNCEVICAPREVLKKESLDFFEADTDKQKLEISRDYKRFNQVRNAKYAEESLRDLMNVGSFNYTGGKISYGNDRYVLAEASLVYLLGKELIKLPEGERMLFDAASRYGEELGRNEKKNKTMNKFIREYLSACGWGDTLIKEKKNNFTIITRLFPWTKFWKDTSFPIYRGMLSGLLSGFKGEKIKLNRIEKDTKVSGFTVIASEN